MEAGRLENESTSSLCLRLADESRTGCLHVVGQVASERPEARIYLRDGQLYTATAPGSTARLGDRLVGGGHLTAEQLDNALQAQKALDISTRLGEVLVTNGLVERKVLEGLLRDQIVDSVAIALAWSVGGWRFSDGEVVAEDVSIGIGVQDILMEGARRLGQLEVIQTQLGSMDTIVDFTSGGTQSKLTLKPDEWAMLTHIDGYTSVAQIADQAGYGQLEAARIIYGLLSAGVVHRVTSSDHPQAPPPAESQAQQRPESGTSGGWASQPAVAMPATPPVPIPEMQPDNPAADNYLDELERLASGPVNPAATPSAADATSPAPAATSPAPAATSPAAVNPDTPSSAPGQEVQSEPTPAPSQASWSTSMDSATKSSRKRTSGLPTRNKKSWPRADTPAGTQPNDDDERPAMPSSATIASSLFAELGDDDALLGGERDAAGNRPEGRNGPPGPPKQDAAKQDAAKQDAAKQDEGGQKKGLRGRFRRS